MKVFKAILNTVVNILIVLVLVISILIAAMALTSKASGISTIFGYTVQTIQSDSMKGGYKGHTLSNGQKVNDEYTGGNFEKGDIIIGKATEFDATRTYQKGDIITYMGVLKGAEDMGEQLICHRITDVQEYNDLPVYQTWGDNESVAELPDQLQVNNYISAVSIASIVHTENYDATVLHGIGKVLDFIRSQLGFFLCVLLPMIVFFLYALVRVVLNFTGYKKSKNDDKLEEEKEAIKREYEEKLKAAGVNVDTTPAEPTPADSAENTPANGQVENATPQPQPQPQAQSTQETAPTTPSMTAEEFEQFKQFMAFQNMQKQYNEMQNKTTETPQSDVEDNTDSDK
ncbi:MAG: hypothetical protein KBS62_07420 [Oscillospiraceae bacterium]|nr:hypothetical protein [Candidatus Ruminococcus equi]